MDTEVLVGSILEKFGYIDNDTLQEILAIQRDLKSKGEEKYLVEILKSKGITQKSKKKPSYKTEVRKNGSNKNILQLDNYDTIEKIGQGGMGIIYKAKQLSTGNIVAIKALSPELTKTASYVGRFLSEMKIIAQLKHPNLVYAFEAGEKNGTLYYVMEYIDGMSSYQLLLQNGFFLEDDVLKIAYFIGKSLCYLHDNSLVHRDIKPQNILITRNGEVKLCDLGIAKEINIRSGETSQSLAGNIIGTPFYMSPEQATGSKLDVRSDIYSLGISLYHLASGTLPFKGNSTEVLNKHAKNRIASLKSTNPATSSHINNLIARMTEHDISKRIQSPYELVMEVEKILSGLKKKSQHVRSIALRKYYLKSYTGKPFIYTFLGAITTAIFMTLMFIFYFNQK
ncbi:MAG: serine/threonine protein kinase [Planctomycetes bacterium]|nr:serine/threonine protein kinase [Planctomycetota bacterium]